MVAGFQPRPWGWGEAEPLHNSRGQHSPYITYVGDAFWDRTEMVLPEFVLPGGPGEKWSESGNGLRESQKDWLMDWKREKQCVT